MNQESDQVRSKTPIRLRFGLRTLLFLMLPVAVGSFWFATRYENAQRQRQVVDWVLNDQRGHVMYDYELRPIAVQGKPVVPGPRWAREWLGIDFFANVRSVVLDNQEVDDLSPLLELQDLAFVGVFIDILPEADVRSLANLKTLEEISIDYSDVNQSDIDVISEALPDCRIWLGHKVRLKK